MGDGALVRLWGEKGKRTAAHGLSAPLYRAFTEGFDTPGLNGPRRCSARWPEPVSV